MATRKTSRPDSRFWDVAADCLHAYRARNPTSAGAFDALEIFGEDSELSCLNRLQLHNNHQMLDIGNPSEELLYAGAPANPLAVR